jgi:hypothetical protein
MQADKIRNVDRAMQDDEQGTIDALSLEDLATLFGHLRRYVSQISVSQAKIMRILTGT